MGISAVRVSWGVATGGGLIAVVTGNASVTTIATKNQSGLVSRKRRTIGVNRKKYLLHYENMRM